MNTKPLKTAHELGDMIVERAILLQGPWPMGMTLFIFEDAFGGPPASVADSAFKRMQVEPRARWLDADEHHLALHLGQGRALKWSRWNGGRRSSRLGHGASLQTGGSTTLSVTGNTWGWTVITRVCAAGNSNASQFAWGVPAKAAAAVGLRV